MNAFCVIKKWFGFPKKVAKSWFHFIIIFTKGCVGVGSRSSTESVILLEKGSHTCQFFAINSKNRVIWKFIRVKKMRKMGLEKKIEHINSKN